jgi:hypothetical protein
LPVPRPSVNVERDPLAGVDPRVLLLVASKR